MKNIAVIPARGGSKRIPRKNIKEFLGKPIIAYSIEAAVKSKLFDEVLVSTDDDEIATISKSYGASIPFLRSKENSDDFATLSDVIDEIKESYKNKGIDNICCILPTAPFVSSNDLIKGYKQLQENPNCDSIRPIVKFSYPIQRALKLEGGFISMFNEEHRTTRSQDLEEAYHDAGQFYWMRFGKGLSGKNKAAYEISEIKVQDIDTMDDWKLAEIKYSIIQEQKKHDNT